MLMQWRLLDAAEPGQAEPVRNSAPSCKRQREEQDEPAASNKQQRTGRRYRGVAPSGRHLEAASEPERPEGARRGRGRADSWGRGLATTPGRQAEAGAEPEQPASSGHGRGGGRGRGRKGSRSRGRGRGRGRASSSSPPQSELAASRRQMQAGSPSQAAGAAAAGEQPLAAADAEPASPAQTGPAGSTDQACAASVGKAATVSSVGQQLLATAPLQAASMARTQAGSQANPATPSLSQQPDAAAQLGPAASVAAGLSNLGQLLIGSAHAAQRPLKAESAALIRSAAGAGPQQPAEPAASTGPTLAGLAGSQGKAGPSRLGQPSEAGAPGGTLLQAASAAAYWGRGRPTGGTMPMLLSGKPASGGQGSSAAASAGPQARSLGHAAEVPTTAQPELLASARQIQAGSLGKAAGAAAVAQPEPAVSLGRTQAGSRSLPGQSQAAKGRAAGSSGGLRRGTATSQPSSSSALVRA